MPNEEPSAGMRLTLPLNSKSAVSKDQCVGRIKGIAEILKSLAMIPLPSLIQPNWEQGQCGEDLLGEFKSECENEARRNKK